MSRSRLFLSLLFSIPCCVGIYAIPTTAASSTHINGQKIQIDPQNAVDGISQGWWLQRVLYTAPQTIVGIRVIPASKTDPQSAPQIAILTQPLLEGALFADAPADSSTNIPVPIETTEVILPMVAYYPFSAPKDAPKELPYVLDGQNIKTNTYLMATPKPVFVQEQGYKVPEDEALFPTAFTWPNGTPNGTPDGTLDGAKGILYAEGNQLKFASPSTFLQKLKGQTSSKMPAHHWLQVTPAITTSKTAVWNLDISCESDLPTIQSNTETFSFSMNEHASVTLLDVVYTLKNGTQLFLGHSNQGAPVLLGAAHPYSQQAVSVLTYANEDIRTMQHFLYIESESRYNKTVRLVDMGCPEPE